jgi:uncharacterized protein YndB with AHSA1/START domain
LTTSTGAEEFFAPKAHIELRVGGPFEICFDPSDATKSSRGHVLSYTPDEMLSFEWFLPPLYPELRNARTWVVVTVHADGPTNSIVKIEHLGWGSGPGWDDAFPHMERGWNDVLGRLQQRFTAGPINWAAEMATGTDKKEFTLKQRAVAAPQTAGAASSVSPTNSTPHLPMNITTITLSVPVRSTTDRLIQAVTTSAGLASWLTPDVQATEPKVGSLVKLTFPPQFGFTVRLDRIDAAGAVDWVIVDGPEEWKGSRITFNAKTDGSTVHLSFTHSGLPEGYPMLAFLTYCWGNHLRSLKLSLETGKGEPWGTAACTAWHPL